MTPNPQPTIVTSPPPTQAAPIDTTPKAIPPPPIEDREANPDAKLDVQDFYNGFYSAAYEIELLEEVADCLPEPDEFLRFLEHGFSINSEKPGKAFGWLLEQVALYGTY